MSEMKDADKEVELRVGELTAREEFGRGIIRVDANTMQKIGVKEGDIVEVEGSRKVGAIVIRAYPSDAGLNVIRMDGLVRRNCGAGVGENVKIRRADVKEARSVTLAPAQKNVFIQVHPNIIKQNIYYRPLSQGDIIVPSPVVRRSDRAPSIFQEYFGFDFEDFFFSPTGETRFVVTNTNPKGIVRISDATDIEILTHLPKGFELEKRKVPTVTYEDVGGIHPAIHKVREMIELPLRHPELFARLGIEPPKGILLHGPPGTGKTLLARAVANEAGANFYSISGPEVFSRWYGGTEQNLRKIFEDAEKSAPSIIFIDEIDAMAPKREEVVGEVEKRTVSQLLCLDPSTKIHTNSSIISIGELYENSSGKIIKDGETEHKIPDKEITVQAINNDGKISNANVIALSKTFVPKAYKISLANSGEIEASPITKFILISNEGINWIQANQIKEGDYILVPKKLSYNEKIHEIDPMLLENKENWIVKTSDNSILRKVFNKKFVKLQDVYLLVKEKVVRGKGIGHKIINELLVSPREKSYLEKKLNISRRSLNNAIRWAVKRGLVNIEGKQLKIIDITGVEKEIREVAYKNNGKISQIKYKYFIRIPEVLNEDLAKFIALVLTEGNIRDYRVNISGEMADLGSKLGAKLFGISGIRSVQKNNVDRVDIQSRALAEFLHQYFSIPKNKKSHKITVPIQLYTSPISVKGAFIGACLDGDGNVGKTHIKIFTSSREFAKGLVSLLASMNLLAKVNSYNIYTVQVFGGSDSFKNFVDVVLPFIELKHKREGLLKLKETAKKISTIIYPIKQLLKDIRDKNNVRLGDEYYRYLSPNLSYNINSNVLGYFIKQLGNIKNKMVNELRRVYASEAIPCMVTKIEEENGGIMYDLTTEFSNFLAGEIPIIVHNTLMDGLKKRGKVVVIAATNRPNALDPALRRPGRFDREIEIPVPDKKGRREVLDIHTRNMPLEKDVNLDHISEITYGFVGADLEALVKEAAMSALRRILPKIKWKEQEELPKDVLEKLIVTKKDFQEAMKMVEPSAMREVLIEIPNVKWNDIGGLEDVKQSLKEAVEWPLTMGDSFTKLGITPPKGILLYGPPGCGKTILAKAIASESNANFISIKGPELHSMWFGESERKVRELFKRAKQVAPTIIFFDEMDALVPKRSTGRGEDATERIVAQLLSEISGLEELKDVVVIGATNRPDMLDTALLRPGRFDRLILVPPPDEKTRLKILELKTKEMPLKGVDLKKLAKDTEGYSGADLEALAREAAMSALRENKKVNEVTMKHFEKALKTFKASIDNKIMEFYQKFDSRHKRKMLTEAKEEDRTMSYVG